MDSFSKFDAKLKALATALADIRLTIKAIEAAEIQTPHHEAMAKSFAAQASSRGVSWTAVEPEGSSRGFTPRYVTDIAREAVWKALEPGFLPALREAEKTLVERIRETRRELARAAMLAVEEKI